MTKSIFLALFYLNKYFFFFLINNTILPITPTKNAAEAPVKIKNFLIILNY